MLSLMDPVEVDGLPIFRDDEDPRKFYVLPDQPAIPVDDEGEAEFLFIKYIKDVEATAEGEEVGGGLVTFRSTLTLEPERKTRVTAALRTRLEEEKAAGRRPFGKAIDSTEPLLAAPLWTAGQVSLATFGVSETGLVRHATTSVPADLAGDLGASFVLELDDDGAEIFWSAFHDRDQQIPIVVSYQLTYKARVSATLSIHAERETLHRRLWPLARPYVLDRRGMARWRPLAHAGELSPAHLVALRAQHAAPVKAMLLLSHVRPAIQQAIVDHEVEVRIETDSAAAGGGEGSVQEALFQLATEVLADRVIPALFGDSAGEPGEDGEVVEVRPAGPDDAGMRFDFQLTSLSTIDRAIAPNGPIHLLLPDAAARASSFKELRLTDGFFSLMKVTVKTSGVDFERDGIASVHVFLEYEARDEKHPDRPWVRRSKDGVLRSESDAVHWRFDTARRADGGHQRAYRYRTEVIYRDGPRSDSGWAEASSRELLLTPRAMGALRVEAALTAAGEAVRSARVALSHATPGGRLYEKTLELTPTSDRKTWFQYTGELAPEETGETVRPEYEARISYRTAQSEIVLPPKRSRDELLEIADPFAERLVFHLRPQGSFEGVQQVAGDLAYEDPEHRHRIETPFSFAKLTDSARVEVPILAGGPRTALVSGRILYADGSLGDLPSARVEPGTVWIGATTHFLQVTVMAVGVDFETDVQLALVTLSRDGASKTFTFSKTATADQVWRLPVADASATWDAKIRFIAYDRTKSAEVVLAGQRDTELLLLLHRPPGG